jgi:hypothetical protein
VAGRSAQNGGSCTATLDTSCCCVPSVASILRRVTNVVSHMRCSVTRCHTLNVSDANEGCFVLALKRAALLRGYAAEFSPGRPPCSADLATIKIAGHLAPTTRVALALSESTVLGS